MLALLRYNQQMTGLYFLLRNEGCKPLRGKIHTENNEHVWTENKPKGI